MPTKRFRNNAPNDRVFAVADDTIASLQPRAPMPVTERRAA